MTDYRKVPELFEKLKTTKKRPIIIFREYDSPKRKELLEELLKLRHKILVAGDPKLAAQRRTAGLHLPSHMLKLKKKWKRRFSNKLLSASVHNERELYMAKISGVDIVIISPILESPYSNKKSLGVINAAKILKNNNKYTYALGGITTNSWRRVRGLSISGIAALRSATALLQ